eukprot:scaffold3960_cov116-Isochrysis_galbana.AAC.3
MPPLTHTPLANLTQGPGSLCSPLSVRPYSASPPGTPWSPPAAEGTPFPHPLRNTPAHPLVFPPPSRSPHLVDDRARRRPQQLQHLRDHGGRSIAEDRHPVLVLRWIARGGRTGAGARTGSSGTRRGARIGGGCGG